MKTHRLLIVVCFFIISCNTEYKPLTIETKGIENSYASSIKVTYDSFKGNSRAENINTIIEKQMFKSIDISTSNETLESGLEAFDKEFKDFTSEFPDASNQPWELIIESETVYQSERIITVMVNTYQYKGGAHGNDVISLLNFDPETGNELALDNLISNLSEFKEVAETYFYKNVKNNSDTENAEDYFFGEDFQLPENIGFNEEGIIMLYNVYEIASYAQGYTEFVIPYEETNTFLKI